MADVLRLKAFGDQSLTACFFSELELVVSGRLVAYLLTRIRLQPSHPQIGLHSLSWMSG